MRICLVRVLAGLSLVCGSGMAQPWWDNYPRMVDSQDTEVVADYHGSLAMNPNGNDPSWGTFFQASEIARRQGNIAAFQNAGIKQIGYFETYGQSYSFVAELGSWNETDLTPVLHHHWNWSDYSGGPIRWLGANNFFDDADFARPYTRTHPRYGGPAMTYPDGTAASGFDGPDTDPRNSRVYDAACSKNVLGELAIDDYKYSVGPTNGLVYIPETGGYAGLILFKKDAACPQWVDYSHASALQAADAGIDGMWTDNFGPWDSFGSKPVKNGFGEWSVGRFQGYLTNNFSAAELALIGVTNAASFDIRDYLREVAQGWGWDGSDLDSPVWKNTDWQNDPLWRAYSIFERQVGTEALSNYYAAVKSGALEGGKPEFLVAGNDIPGFSLGWSRGELDMVSTEMSLGFTYSTGFPGITPPPVGRFAPFYKLAREHARSRFVNIWLYTDGYVSELSHPELCKVLYYEMMATHTFPKFAPDNSRIAGDPATNRGFFDFVGQAAPVFGDRVPVEDVGVYYSSSSVLRQLAPGGFYYSGRQPHQFGFWGWATALGELHYQYRAVPEWKLSPELLETLRVLVVPNADVLDPAIVANVLEPWLDAGGRMVITGDSGKYLGESGNFDPNPAGWSIASITNHANVVYLSDNIGMDYYLAYGSRPALLPQFENAMDSALFGAPEAGIVDTTASSRVGLTAYSGEAGSLFFVDVNNLDIDPDTFEMTDTGTFTVEAVLPEALRGKTLSASVLSPQASRPSVDLLAASDASHVKFVLGSVDYYASVVVSEAVRWGDPAASGDWGDASRWVPALVPQADDAVVWRYATGDPIVAISVPAVAESLAASRSDASSSYWNAGGLEILHYGANGGSLVLGGGSGILDMWDGGWYGSRLYVVNEDAAAAADILDVAEARVRVFQVDTRAVPSATSCFEHESGLLSAKVQLVVGGSSVAGNRAEFLQTGGNVVVDHNDYGLLIGTGATQGSYLLDGGTTSVSTVEFANPDSTFEFNGGTFLPGARNVVWKGGGRLLLSGKGEHRFIVDSGYAVAVGSDVPVSDKPGELGSLVKEGGGTLLLGAVPNLGGTVDVRQGALSLPAGGAMERLYLLVDSSADVSLDFSGTNTIRALSFGGGATWAASGVWGGAGSGAEHESGSLSGTGFLLVETDRVAPQSWTAACFSENEVAAGLAKDDRDPDGDGMSNWAEYVAGTDPVDAASALMVRLEPMASGVELLFDSVTGRTYSLFYSTNLVEGGWEMLGTNLPGTGGEISVADSNDWNSVYYHFKASLP